MHLSVLSHKVIQHNPMKSDRSAQNIKCSVKAAILLNSDSFLFMVTTSHYECTNDVLQLKYHMQRPYSLTVWLIADSFPPLAGISMFYLSYYSLWL